MLLAEMTEAWMIRQIWIAELHGSMVVKMLSKALSGGEKSNRVSDVELLGQMGIAI